ncbi:MAG: hypothetical protein Tsb002_15140 [Wenzhouxiangellaceae bacterium]
MRAVMLNAFLLASLMLPAAWAQPDNSEWLHERREWQLEPPTDEAVRVENRWGDIRVRTHEQRQIYVLANIQRHQQDSRSMDLVLDEENPGLGITTYFPADDKQPTPADWQPRRIDLTVFVPATQRLALTTEHGLLEARGVQAALSARTENGAINLRAKGAVDAESRYGEIQVFFLDSNWSSDSRLQTQTGSIEALFARGFDARVEFETHGQITTDFSVTIERDQHEEYKTGYAKIGSAKQKLTIKSDRGAIRLLSSAVPDSADQ